MEKRHVYIDYNATTPLRDEVKSALIEDLDLFGNASSMHGSGRQARGRVEEARIKVAALINALPEEIIFNSGGSESNNTVFQTMRVIALNKGANNGAKPVSADRKEIITTSIEHPCVLNTAQYLKDTGFTVTFLPVDECGKIKMDALKEALSEKTLLVSVMAANNEIGTIQDIKEICALSRNVGAFFHTDASQAAGKIPVDVKDLGVDYLTMSGHKIYGPKGIGALYVRHGAPVYPLIHGGHQEAGLRAGTHNNLGILGFGKAAELALRDIAEYGKKCLF
jgi:cysteine desulfurase